MRHRLTTQFFPFILVLISDRLVGSGPPYDSTVELGLLMCHGLKGQDTSTNSTVESGLVGTSWCMCHRLKTRFFVFILV